jgi:hypothetical protein
MNEFSNLSNTQQGMLEVLDDRELEAVQGGILHALLVPAAIIATGAVLIGRELSKDSGGGGVPQDLIDFAKSGGKVRPPA